MINRQNEGAVAFNVGVIAIAVAFMLRAPALGAAGGWLVLGALVPYAAITCCALSYAYWPGATLSQLSLRITPERNSIATPHNPMSHMRELGRTNQIVR